MSIFVVSARPITHSLSAGGTAIGRRITSRAHIYQNLFFIISNWRVDINLFFEIYHGIFIETVD